MGYNRGAKVMATNKSEFITMGYRTICNYGGIEIQIEGEKIRYSYFGEVSKKWQNIKYTLNGDPYFTIKGKREYLRNYMRV